MRRPKKKLEPKTPWVVTESHQPLTPPFYHEDLARAVIKELAKGAEGLELRKEPTDDDTFVDAMKVRPGFSWGGMTALPALLTIAVHNDLSQLCPKETSVAQPPTLRGHQEFGGVGCINGMVAPLLTAWMCQSDECELTTNEERRPL